MNKIRLLVSWYVQYLKEAWQRNGLFGVFVAFVGLGSDVTNPFTDWAEYFAIGSGIALAGVIIWMLLTGKSPPETPFQKQILGDALSISLFCAIIFSLIYAFQLIFGKDTATEVLVKAIAGNVETATRQLGDIKTSNEDILTRARNIEQILSKGEPIRDPSTDADYVTNAIIYRERNDLARAWSSIQNAIDLLKKPKIEALLLYREIGELAIDKTSASDKLSALATSRNEPFYDYLGRYASGHHSDKQTIRDILGFVLKNVTNSRIVLTYAHDSVMHSFHHFIIDDENLAMSYLKPIHEAAAAYRVDFKTGSEFYRPAEGRDFLDRVDSYLRTYSDQLSELAARIKKRSRPPDCTYSRFGQGGMIDCAVDDYISTYDVTVGAFKTTIANPLPGARLPTIMINASGVPVPFSYDLSWTHKSGSKFGPFRYSVDRNNTIRKLDR